MICKHKKVYLHQSRLRAKKHILDSIFFNPSHLDIRSQPIKRPRQRERPGQQREHDDVGEERREPDDVAALVEAAADDEVHDEPSQEEGAGQFPLKGAQTVLQATVHPNHTITAGVSLGFNIVGGFEE